MSNNLDAEVRGLLEGRRGDWLVVAERAGVSYSWISKFVNRRIPNPGYGTLVKLHESLSSAQSSGAPEPTTAGLD